MNVTPTDPSTESADAPVKVVRFVCVVLTLAVAATCGRLPALAIATPSSVARRPARAAFRSGLLSYAFATAPKMVSAETVPGTIAATVKAAVSNKVLRTLDKVNIPTTGSYSFRDNQPPPIPQPMIPF